ncbi:hypothetical protein BV22DRAFT_1127390 [Leucogyrophana mollusca]|uniref:Uncharacterized protein n=1 Tax=Leucogyrophana mollusca TaxID=85980 RepID=A0ACB8BPP5_9AGAM|nr:hypothetical protein BV22DRAFT_1127390 [Leucogyrophana mollusca]
MDHHPAPDHTQSTFELLVSLLQSNPTSIEILPGDASTWVQEGTNTFPFLFIDNNLGVPQKILYKAFMVGMANFKLSRRQALSLTASSQPAIRDLIASSAVILLTNPAHQTALNTRKHLVVQGSLDPSAELSFTAALLSSQHCAKESIIWHHRQWLLRRIYPPSTSDAFEDGAHPGCLPIPCIPPDALRKELGIVTRACELYPRNYFAWAHRYFCMRHTLDNLVVNDSAHDEAAYTEIVLGEISNVKQWIERHVADFSAVHYLVKLSACAQDSNFFAATRPSWNSLSFASHAKSLVQSFPSHEALWMYMRATALFEVSTDDEDTLEEFSRNFAAPLATPQNEEQLSALYARRFLFWLSHTNDVRTNLSIWPEGVFTFF